MKRWYEQAEIDNEMGDVASFEKPITEYDPRMLYNAYATSKDSLATNRFYRIIRKFGCTPEEIAEAIRTYEDHEGDLEFTDWINYIVSCAHKHLDESVDNDIGDIDAFDKPSRVSVGDRVQLCIPDRKRRPEWLHFYQHLEGLTGTVVELGQQGSEEHPVNSEEALIAFDNGKSDWFNHEWLRPLQESTEDVGDVSEYEEPPVRSEEIVRWWKSLYTTRSPQDAAREVSRNLGISIEDVCQALERTGQMEGVSGFASVIRAQANKGNFFDESVDDMGDTEEFEAPTDTQRVRIIADVSGLRKGSVVTIDRTPLPIFLGRPGNKSYRVVDRSGRLIPQGSFEPILNENTDDEFDVEEFKQPQQYFPVRVMVPGDAENYHDAEGHAHSHRDVWKFDGKIVPAARHKRYSDIMLIYSKDNPFDSYQIPAEWCEPVDGAELPEWCYTLKESVDDDIGDVDSFPVPVLPKSVQSLVRRILKNPNWDVLYLDKYSWGTSLRIQNSKLAVHKVIAVEEEATMIVDRLKALGALVPDPVSPFKYVIRRDTDIFTESVEDPGFGDVSEFEKPTTIHYVRVTKSNPDKYWDVGDELYIIPMRQPLYPRELYDDEDDEESPYNTFISWLDDDTKYYILASRDEAIAEDEAEPIVGKTHLPESTKEIDFGDVDEFEEPVHRGSVQVTQTNRPPSWYADYIGQAFELLEPADTYSFHYHVKGPGNANRYMIEKQHAQLLQESTDDMDDVGDVSAFTAPTAEPPLYVKLIRGSYGWADDTRVGEVFEINRKGYPGYKDHYRIAKKNRESDGTLLPKEDCVIVDSLLQESVEEIDFGDMDEFEKPRDTMLMRYTKTGEVLEVKRFPEPEIWGGTTAYKIVSPEKYRDHLVGEDWIEPVTASLTEGANDDMGDMSEFEEPSDFMAVKVTQSRRNKNYKAGDMFFVEPTRDGMGYDEDTGLYAYKTFRKVFPNGTTIPSHGFIIYDDAYEIDVPEQFKGSRKHLFNKKTESIDELGDIDDFERPANRCPDCGRLGTAGSLGPNEDGDRLWDCIWCNISWITDQDMKLIESVNSEISTIRPRQKESTMADTRKRWFEANEVNPESGYISEVPDPEEDLGTVENYDEPTLFPLTKELINKPSYYDAWKFFDEHFREFSDGRARVPFGSGAFEGWWTGSTDDPDAAPSPRGEITKEDIDKLAIEGDGQGQGGEVFGLFMNTFYHGKIGRDMDMPTLVYLVKKAMRMARSLGCEEQVEMEFPIIFDTMDEEEKEEFWMAPGAYANQIATEIKSGRH